MGRFATLKKIGSKIWVAKNRVEKIGPGLFLLFRKRKGSLANGKQKQYGIKPEKNRFDAKLYIF